MASDRGSGWAFPIKHPIRSSESSPVPLPSVKTPKIDALTAYRQTLHQICPQSASLLKAHFGLTFLWRWCISTIAKLSVEFLRIPSDPVNTVFRRLLASWCCSLCHVLTNLDTITGRELGPKHMRAFPIH